MEPLTSDARGERRTSLCLCTKPVNCTTASVSPRRLVLSKVSSDSSVLLRHHFVTTPAPRLPPRYARRRARRGRAPVRVGRGSVFAGPPPRGGPVGERRGAVRRGGGRARAPSRGGSVGDRRDALRLRGGPRRGEEMRDPAVAPRPRGALGSGATARSARGRDATRRRRARDATPRADDGCCAICLGEMETPPPPSTADGLSSPSDPAVTTPCGHRYHARCIVAALDANRGADDPGEPTCPTCRRPLVPPRRKRRQRRDDGPHNLAPILAS